MNRGLYLVDLLNYVLHMCTVYNSSKGMISVTEIQNNKRLRTYFWMHNEERQFGGELAAQCTQEQLDLDRIRHDNAEHVFNVGTWYSETIWISWQGKSTLISLFYLSSSSNGQNNNSVHIHTVKQYVSSTFEGIHITYIINT